MEVECPYWTKLCIHVHITSVVIQVVVVFVFSWFAIKMMIDSLGKLSINCCQVGDCWVVTTHTLAVSIQRFLK
jgi:hypothetical protein